MASHNLSTRTMKYRIDFSRLARTEDEVIKDKLARDFIGKLIKRIAKDVTPIAINEWDDFRKSFPDGHILDNEIIEAEEDLDGPQVLDKFIKPKYAEAKILSWDRIKE